MEIVNTHSDDIKEIISALVKVQAVLKPAIFNKVNPHFKSRYADFSSCMDTCRIPLSENGIAVIQSCQTIDNKLCLVTMLAHTSGQWIKSEFPIISSKMDSQGIGSAMTYAKRYSLSGLIGIVADEDTDDDGESSVGRGKSPKPKESVHNEKELLNKFLNLFDKEEKLLAMEYLKVVQKHFDWTVVHTIEQLMKDIPKLFEKFNTWNIKNNKTEDLQIENQSKEQVE